MIQVQLDLQQLTGGWMHCSWNGAILPPHDEVH